MLIFNVLDKQFARFSNLVVPLDKTPDYNCSAFEMLQHQLEGQLQHCIQNASTCCYDFGFIQQWMSSISIIYIKAHLLQLLSK